MRFPIGTRFTTRGKHPRLCTVVDAHTTIAGTTVTDYDVPETTIAMGFVS